MSPEQQAFTQIRAICAALYGEANVFDYLPGDVPYPFIYIGDQNSQNIRLHKDGTNKATQVIVHVWHNEWTERGVVTGMIHELEKAFARTYGPDVSVPNITIAPDTSTGKKLIHATLDVDITV